MAHELSFDSAGNAEAFYSLKPAWHGLGTVLDHAPTSEAAIEAAHLDWHVDMRPLRTDDGIDVPDHFATVRSDSRDILGVVSDKYKVVQNRDAFKFLDSLVSDGELKYESAGALKGGKVVWILGRMPTDDVIAEGDVSRRYVLFSANHAGEGAIHTLGTSTRVVCANTLRVSIAGHRGIRHTGDVHGKLREARLLLSQLDAGFTLFRDSARLLAERKFTPEQSREYIEQLFPSVLERGRSLTIRDHKVETVRRNFRNERNNLPAIRGTWWQLLNSVTESIDHDPRRKYTTTDAREQRLLSTVDGPGADFKVKAFDLAVKMSA